HDSLGRQARAAAAAAPPGAAQDDGLVGRSVELRRVASLLEEGHCRLLTIVGPGGVGKTRLAQRALPRRAPSFADGAFFIPLEDLSSADQVGGRIARELGIDLAGGSEPLAQVIDFLGERKLLLVLDNFEPFAEDAGILQRLADACQSLHL